MKPALLEMESPDAGGTLLFVAQVAVAVVLAFAAGFGIGYLLVDLFLAVPT